jgi:beta-N-acetylhexosaminidase
VIGDVIRGEIGFDGFLMSDDIGMNALGGGFDERARGVIEAGTDAVLHCSGKIQEMVAVASAAGELGGAARKRLERAMASVAGASDGLAYEVLAEKRDRLLALA